MEKRLFILASLLGVLTLLGHSQPSCAQDLADRGKSYKEQNSKLAAEEAKLLRELVGTNLTQASDVTPPVSAPKVTTSEPSLAEQVPIVEQDLRLKEIPEEPQVKKAVTTVNRAPKPKAVASSSSERSGSEAALISNIQRTSMELVGKLREREERISTLQSELDETRSRLIVAETEVERLSKHLDSRNMNSIGAYNSAKMFPNRASMKEAPVATKPIGRNITAPPQAVEVDMPVVTVIADKAALRTGPGPDNSPLMEVSRGTVLTVETRSGNWYRVNTPTGTRAWISGEVVRFGNSGAEPSSSLRMGGYDTSAEDEALKLIKQRPN